MRLGSPGRKAYSLGFLGLRAKVYPRDPGIQIIPTLGPKVCKYYLHWAIWSKVLGIIFNGTF